MDDLKQTSSLSSITVRDIVENLATRFSSSEAARHMITERAMNVILQNPELDLNEPHRELLPIVRAVAADYLRKSAESPREKNA